MPWWLQSTLSYCKIFFVLLWKQDQYIPIITILLDHLMDVKKQFVGFDDDINACREGIMDPTHKIKV
jgi:hypothetical protein